MGKLEAFHMLEEIEERLLDAVKVERLNLKVGFAEIARKECASGIQKAEVKWASEDDCNSVYFYKVVGGRKNKNFIKPLRRRLKVY